MAPRIDSCDSLMGGSDGGGEVIGVFCNEYFDSLCHAIGEKTLREKDTSDLVKEASYLLEADADVQDCMKGMVFSNLLLIHSFYPYGNRDGISAVELGRLSAVLNVVYGPMKEEYVVSRPDIFS